MDIFFDTYKKIVINENSNDTKFFIGINIDNKKYFLKRETDDYNFGTVFTFTENISNATSFNDLNNANDIIRSLKRSPKWAELAFKNFKISPDAGLDLLKVYKFDLVEV